MKSKLTVNDLINGTRKYRELTIEYGKRVGVLPLDLIHAILMKTVEAKSDAMSSNGKESYHQTIQFGGVEFSPIKTEECSIGIKVGDTVFYRTPIKKNETPCNVKCTCPSYRWDFQNANQQIGANNSGKIPYYKKKTDRAPKNPTSIPGFCKHLVGVVAKLEYDGILV